MLKPKGIVHMQGIAMTTTIISDDIFTGFFVAGSDDQNVYVLQDVTVFGETTGIGAFSATVNIRVDGTVAGGSSSGISAFQENSVITIGATGRVLALELQNSDPGVLMSASGGTVINDGLIEGAVGLSSLVDSGSTVIADVSVTNGGIIRSVGLQASVSLVGNAALNFQTAATVFSDLNITNTGLIEATRPWSSSIALPSGADAVALRADSYGASVNLTNSGTIIGAIVVGTANNRIDNTGEIFGAIYGNVQTDLLSNGGTIYDSIDLGGGRDRLINTGEINGDTITTGAGDDDVINAGAIVGTLVLGDGEDLYIARPGGFVTGAVDGGAGNDTIRGGDFNDILAGGLDNDEVSGGNGDDELFGLEGDDLLSGNAGADLIRGGDGNDTLLGGAGTDLLEGGNGLDRIQGGDGDDTLLGEAERDVLRGNAGDDALDGGSGNDVLRGDAGDDTLTGGTGRDDLFGGAGSDQFVYASVADMQSGPDRDRIQDFQDGLDLIDLSALGPLADGGTAATGGGTASFWTVSVASGTFLRVDSDGDGVHDGEILLRGLPQASLGADDLILA